MKIEITPKVSRQEQNIFVDNQRITHNQQSSPYKLFSSAPATLIIKNAKNFECIPNSKKISTSSRLLEEFNKEQVKHPSFAYQANSFG